MKKILGFLLSLTIILTSCESFRNIPLVELPDPQDSMFEADDLPVVIEQWKLVFIGDGYPGEGIDLKTASADYWTPGPDYSSSDGISDTDIFSISSLVIFYKSPPIIWPLKPPSSMGDYKDLVWETINSAPSFGDASRVWHTTLTTKDGITLPAYFLEFVKSGRRSIVTILIKGMPGELAEMTIYDLAGRIERKLPAFDKE